MLPLFDKWPALAFMRSSSVPEFRDRARHFGPPDSPGCTPRGGSDRTISCRAIEVTSGLFRFCAEEGE